MVKPNFWIDKTPKNSGQIADAQLTQSDRSVMGRVSGTHESDPVSIPEGWVEVTIPDSTEPPVVVPSDGGITGLGASVLCGRDSSGRIVSAAIPQSLPAGAEPVAVGVVGEWLASLDATTAATQAQLDAAEQELDAARARLNDPETGLDAVQSRANDAVRDAAQAMVDASSAVVLRVDSSRGLVFKNNSVSTLLTVTVFAKGRTITDIVDLQDAFGPSAYLEWQWRRIDDSDFGTISSADSRIGGGGFTFSVNPNDVDTKTVFMCVLKAD